MLVVLTGIVAACTAEEKEVPKAAATPAATQSVGAAAPAATQAVGATPASTQAAGAGTDLVWPEKWRKGTVPILGAIRNAVPRATPAPLPAGVTATPAAPRPTPGAPRKEPIIFYVDTTTAGAGESPFNVDATIGCARTSMFSRGMHVVWRLTAFDNTGTELQPATIETLVLKVGGKEAAFRYGKHGDAGWFWTATYDIPMDAPLGTLDWSVGAKTKAGATATYKELAAFTAPGAERLMADGTKTSSDSRTMIVN